MGGWGGDLKVRGQQSHIPPPDPPQIQTGPTAASPLIVQVNQGPDVIAEVDFGHYTPWIGLAAATNMDAEPAVGLGTCTPPCAQSHSPQGWRLSCPWFLVLGWRIQLLLLEPNFRVDPW